MSKGKSYTKDLEKALNDLCLNLRRNLTEMRKLKHTFHDWVMFWGTKAQYALESNDPNKQQVVLKALSESMIRTATEIRGTTGKTSLDNEDGDIIKVTELVSAALLKYPNGDVLQSESDGHDTKDDHR